MFEIRGKCVICTQRYVTNNISALPCGHVFHYDCILQWLKSSLTCPICRRFISSSQIVKHLFFDDPDDPNNSSLLSASPNSQAHDLLLAEEKVRELENTLRRKEEDIQKLKNAYSCAKLAAVRDNLRIELLVAEKETLTSRNALLDAKIKEMGTTLETTKRRLQVCEFYKVVTTGDSEIYLDTFVTDDGSLEMQRFLTIQKRELHEARNLQNKLREELREEREQLRATKEEKVELENLVKSLERELRDAGAIWDKPLKQRLRPRNNAATNGTEKSQENTAGKALPKRKTRRPLVEKKNHSQEDANPVDS